jgi:heptosyltransferase-2
MMNPPRKVLVFHTAFIGDILLMLPLVQVVRKHFPDSRIAVVAIPAASESLLNHPAIDNVIIYDKKGRDAGFQGMIGLGKRLKGQSFDLALVPHRSIRSALIVWLARIPRRVGFSNSAGKFFFTDLVPYVRKSHESSRNLSLLAPLGIRSFDRELPALYPSEKDVERIDDLLGRRDAVSRFNADRAIGIAPGSVWNTKRWPKEHFIALGRMLLAEGFSLALIGGTDDRQLCFEIESSLESGQVLNAAGSLTLLQSAELIRRCKAIVSNDSAPTHMAVAMRTPVVAIYGATVPEFGFAPQGEHDVVLETQGLSCRPCSIHGGEACPIKTFVCMRNISADMVFEKIQSVTNAVQANGSHAKGQP